jgi:hypothetical protein
MVNDRLVFSSPNYFTDCAVSRISSYDMDSDDPIAPKDKFKAF